MQQQNTIEKSNKNWLIAALLAFFLGGIGLHRLYVGRKKSGWIMFFCGLTVFLTVITVIISWVDFFKILLGVFKDSDGKTL